MSERFRNFVTQSEHHCPDLDGLHIKPPEVIVIGSELARKLIGRDFSEISVSAKDRDLVWATVTFPIYVEDIETLRKMKNKAFPPKELTNE